MSNSGRRLKNRLQQAMRHVNAGSSDVNIEHPTNIKTAINIGEGNVSTHAVAHQDHTIRQTTGKDGGKE
jgi:hypothetical protein